MRRLLTRAFSKHTELGRYRSWLGTQSDEALRFVRFFAGNKTPDLTPLSIPEPFRTLLLSTLELHDATSTVITRSRTTLLELARHIQSGTLLNEEAYRASTPQEELLPLLQLFDAWTYTLREHCCLLDHVLSKVRAGHYYEATQLAQ